MDSPGSRQRLVVTSQALEIRQLQDTLKAKEKELCDKEIRHLRERDEQKQLYNNLSMRNSQLEKDIHLLANKLRTVQDEHVNKEYEETYSIKRNDEEKDNHIKQLTVDIEKLRLEYRDLEEEKSILLNKLVDERKKNAIMSDEADKREELLVILKEKCVRLERASYECNLPEASQGTKVVIQYNDGNKSDNRTFREELRLRGHGGFPVTTGTQTTSDVLLPSVFGEETCNDTKNPLTSSFEKKHLERLQYLLYIEGERAKFHENQAKDHHCNVDRLKNVTKIRVEEEMSRLRHQQYSLAEILKNTDTCAPHTIDNNASDITNEESSFRSSPFKKLDQYNKMKQYSPSVQDADNTSFGDKKSTYITDDFSSSNKYFYDKKEADMNSLRKKLQALQDDHERSLITNSNYNSTLAGRGTDVSPRAHLNMTPRNHNSSTVLNQYNGGSSRVMQHLTNVTKARADDLTPVSPFLFA